MDAKRTQTAANRGPSQKNACVFNALGTLNVGKAQMGAESGPNGRAAVTREVV